MSILVTCFLKIRPLIKLPQYRLLIKIVKQTLDMKQYQCALWKLLTQKILDKYKPGYNQGLEQSQGVLQSRPKHHEEDRS